MRVAYITRSGFGVLGGANSYQIPAHVAAHHAVRVLSPAAPARGAEEVVYRRPGLDVVELCAESDAGLIDEACAALRAFSPDIVHLFHGRRCLPLLRALRRDFPGARRVMDFQSPPLIERFAARQALRLRYWLCQFYVDHIFTHAPASLADNIPLCFRAASELPPGVDLAAFDARARPAPRPVRFVYAGSLAHARRLGTLLRGFARFARGRPERPRLLLLGGGNALPGLRALAAREGLEHCVEFAGPVPQPEVYARLVRCDAGVAWVPGGLLERAPSLKMLEYAAAGLPVLASDTAGHRDYARRFGFRFIPFGNSEDGVAAGLARASDAGAAAADIAANLKAVARFDWRRIVAEDVLPVYERLQGHSVRTPSRTLEGPS